MKTGEVIKDLGGEHVAKPYGRCVVCRRITWGFADQPCPDWRGRFAGSTHCDFEATDYDMSGPDVPVCASCFNTRATYERGLEAAKLRWTKPLNSCDFDHQTTEQVRLLPTSGGPLHSNMIVCRKHYEHEIKYRRDMGARGYSDMNPFPEWESLKIYKPE